MRQVDYFAAIKELFHTAADKFHHLKEADEASQKAEDDQFEDQHAIERVQKIKERGN